MIYLQYIRINGEEKLIMALIICPDCGKEISDKSTVCIHCGCPISHIDENGIDLDLLKKYIVEDNVKASQYINDVTNWGVLKSKSFMREYAEKNNLVMGDHIYKTPKPHCPKCGSTSITTGARGVNGFWGFIGASKTVNRCGNCGYTWKP